MIPFAIDTYGAWGCDFGKYLKAKCSQATCDKLQLEEYNRMLWESKCRIQFAHARAMAGVVRKMLDLCVPDNRKIDCITGRVPERYGTSSYTANAAVLASLDAGDEDWDDSSSVMSFE